MLNGYSSQFKAYFRKLSLVTLMQRYIIHIHFFVVIKEKAEKEREHSSPTHEKLK